LRYAPYAFTPSEPNGSPSRNVAKSNPSQPGILRPISRRHFRAALYGLPEPTDIHSDAILHNDALRGLDGFDDDPTRLERLYRHTIQWLWDEGYLRFSEVATQGDNTDVFCNTVLTAKGLEALRKTPTTLAGPGLTIGDQIEATAKDIGSDTAKSVMKELVGQALGWIVRGVTGL
jgi:hypothetical protein